MRVTDLTIQRNFLYNIFNAEKRLGSLQEMASSGKAIGRPRTILWFGKSISLRHNMAVNNQYLRNMEKREPGCLKLNKLWGT